MNTTTNTLESTAMPCRAEIGPTLLKILLCDDDPLFLESLRTNIRNILNAHKISAAIQTFRYAEEIPNYFLSSYEVFFLDINFHGKEYSGIDIARKIRQTNPDAVIVFVTNCIDFAPDGYEVQAFRYVLKDKIKVKLEQYLSQIVAKLKMMQETIQISISGEITTIPLVDILYIETIKHKVYVHVLKHKSQSVTSYCFYSSLSSVEKQLSEKGFLRVQKSYLVNMRKITKFSCSEAILENGTKLRVSEKNYAEQKKKYLICVNANIYLSHFPGK